MAGAAGTALLTKRKRTSAQWALREVAACAMPADVSCIQLGPASGVVYALNPKPARGNARGMNLGQDSAPLYLYLCPKQ